MFEFNEDCELVEEGRRMSSFHLGTSRKMDGPLEAFESVRLPRYCCLRFAVPAVVDAEDDFRLSEAKAEVVAAVEAEVFELFPEAA